MCMAAEKSIFFIHIFQTCVNIDCLLIKINVESTSNTLFWNLK